MRLDWIWGLHMPEESEAEDLCISNEMAESNFIKAKCSYPSTIVHSFYFWKAFIVLINVKNFVEGDVAKCVVSLHHLAVRS